MLAEGANCDRPRDHSSFAWPEVVRRVTASSYQMEELRRWTQAATAVPTMRTSTTKGSAKCARAALFVRSEALSPTPGPGRTLLRPAAAWQFALGFGGGTGPPGFIY